MTRKEMRERRAVIIKTLYNLTRFDLGLSASGRLELLRELKTLDSALAKKGARK